MEKIIENLRSEINGYVESKLLKYQNESTEREIIEIRKDMYDYKENIKKMLDKQLITQNEYDYVKHLFFMFGVLKVFLEICNTKIYIGYESITQLLKTRDNKDIMYNFNIYTDRNIIIKINRSRLDSYYSLYFNSINKNDDNLSFIIYIHNLGNEEQINIQNIQNYILHRDHNPHIGVIDPYTFKKYVEILKNTTRNMDYYLMDLDYLMISRNEVVKGFMEKNHIIQLLDKDEKINELYLLIEEKNKYIEISKDELINKKKNY